MALFKLTVFLSFLCFFFFFFLGDGGVVELANVSENKACSCAVIFGTSFEVKKSGNVAYILNGFTLGQIFLIDLL